ncbi:30S ribosomal protein S18 [Hymenobacter agri]|jgi:small subunit ribosomal protein S18
MASPAFNRNNDRSANKPQDNRKKYCRFKKNGIKYVDYKDPNFLLKFVNEQGRVLPRRLTGTSLKFQRKVTQAIAKARHLALMPYVADALK